MRAGGREPDMRAGDRRPDNPNTSIIFLFTKNLRQLFFYLDVSKEDTMKVLWCLWIFNRCRTPTKQKRRVSSPDMFKYKKNGPFFSNFVSLIFNIGLSQNFCQKNITQAEKYLEIIYFFCLSRTKTTSDLQRQRLGLQISGISRKQKLSMLVSIGAQHSHLDQVLLPILPSTSIVVASLLLTRSLV